MPQPPSRVRAYLCAYDSATGAYRPSASSGIRVPYFSGKVLGYQLYFKGKAVLGDNRTTLYLMPTQG